MSTELTGAEIAVRCLQKEGVDYIFGYPGGAVLFIYDELFKQDKVKHVLVRHEQAAVHAADGYARSSNKVGVALVTSGPGVTNAVTGIATAYMDSIPLVIISGQVPTHAIGLDAFQEVDTVGITRPCVKHNFLVKDITELAATIKKAFYIASTGRPGPVLVDIPKDVSQQKTEFDYPAKCHHALLQPGHQGARRTNQESGTADTGSQASDDLRGRRRHPERCGGATDRSGTNAGFSLHQHTDGIGRLSGNRQAVCRHAGHARHLRSQHGNAALRCVVAVGARFDDRVIGNPKHFSNEDRKIIHIDIDPSSISKRVKVDIPIVGNVSDVLDELIKLLKARKEKPDQIALDAWWTQIDLWRARDCLKYDRASSIIKPQMVVEKLYEVTGGNAFITSDVGQHQMWAAQFYKFDLPRRWINSGGLGTMGFGLPSAMGVQFANPGGRWLVSLARPASRCAFRNCPPASSTTCR